MAEESCNWFTYSVIWRMPSNPSDGRRSINDLRGDLARPPAAMTQECRFYSDCPNIATCHDCVSGHKDCILQLT